MKTARDAQTDIPDGNEREKEKKSEQVHKLQLFALGASLPIHFRAVNRNLQVLVVALIRGPGRQVPLLPQVQRLVFKYTQVITVNQHSNIQRRHS